MSTHDPPHVIFVVVADVSYLPPHSDSGVLVFTGSLRGEEVKDGSILNLGIAEWRARIHPEHLELVRVVRTDDKREKGHEKRENIKNELAMRKQEVAALAVQRGELIGQCEEVFLN